MRFSVILTVFNYARYVCEAVDSALAQTHRPSQIVVVDDGSTDDSAALLRERYADEPLVTLMTQQNAGQIAAAQLGLSRVNGEIVCFLDGDDWWEPTYLETLARAYAADPGIDYIATNMRLRGQHEGALLLPGGTDYDYGISSLVTYVLGEGLTTPTSAVSLRLDFARRALRVPDVLVAEWRIGLDNCLGCGAGMHGARKVQLGSALANYRLHDANNFYARTPSRSAALQNYMKLQRLLHHYAEDARMCAASVDWICQEFQTRPAPSWADTKRYLRIAGSSRRSLPTRIRYALSILRHYLAPQRSARRWASGG